jgi:hypothetical protein
MRIVTGLRVVALLALVAGFVVFGAGRVAAQTTFTGTIHAMECYHGVGPDIFDECHTDVTTSSELVQIDGTTVTFNIPEEELAGYLGAYVYCSNQLDGTVLADGSYADGIAFEVQDGDEILCDIYFIVPAPDGGATDDGATDGGTTTDSTTTNSSTGGTTLPATGVGPAETGDSLMLLAVLALGVTGAGLALRRTPR